MRDIFKKSHEFKEIQHGNTLDMDNISIAQLWMPLLDSTVMSVNDCLVKEKSLLASKQKILTKHLEEILVGFVNMRYKDFEVDSLFALPGPVRGIICLYALNFH